MFRPCHKKTVHANDQRLLKCVFSYSNIKQKIKRECQFCLFCTKNVNTGTGYKYSIKFDNAYEIIQRKDGITSLCLLFNHWKSFGLRKYFTEYVLLIKFGWFRNIKTRLRNDQDTWVLLNLFDYKIYISIIFRKDCVENHLVDHYRYMKGFEMSLN